jgi:hypothetical protein
LAKLIGTELPDDLYTRLRGDRLEDYADKVLLISTLDAEGWPHPAMLSYFEVVACNRRDIRLAVYAHSRTTENMRQRGKATLLIIDERLAYYVKGTVTELRRTMVSAPHNSSLRLHVAQVLADEANEEYEAGAYVAGGVTYYNPNHAAELAQARVIIKELGAEGRAAAPESESGRGSHG